MKTTLIKKSKKENQDTFCYGSVTRNEIFWTKIFSKKTTEELKEDLAFFENKKEKSGLTVWDLQINTINKLIKRAA